MAIADQARAVQDLLPQIRIAAAEKNWKELVRVTNTARKHLDIIRAVAENLIEELDAISPPPPPPPAKENKRTRVARADLPTFGPPGFMTEFFTRQMQGMNVNECRTIALPDDMLSVMGEMRLRKICASAASGVFGNGNWSVCQRADRKSLDVWRRG